MIRLVPLLLFLLPIAIFVVWFALAVRKERLAASGALPRWQQAPWTAIVMATLLAVAVLLGVLALVPDGEPWAPYTPPHMEDGVIVPDHVDD